MQGSEGHMQRGLEVVEQLLGHLRDVFLEAVSRVEIDGPHVVQSFE
jgi:hypothetical protein